MSTTETVTLLVADFGWADPANDHEITRFDPTTGESVEAGLYTVEVQHGASVYDVEDAYDWGCGDTIEALGVYVVKTADLARPYVVRKLGEFGRIYW